MIATRLSSVWQVAGVAGAALCCYLVSQSVAAERAGLAAVDAEIARTHDQIAMLQTEIGTRTQAQQVERWNVEHFALRAPRPEQFVGDAVQLVSLYARGASGPQLPLDRAVTALQGSAEKVAYRAAPPVPTQTPVQPLLRTAALERFPPALNHIAFVPSAVEGRAARATRRVSTSLDTNGEGTGPIRPAMALVRPKLDRLAPDAAPIERAAYHPAAQAIASLLPADIADKAAAEQAAGPHR